MDIARLQELGGFVSPTPVSTEITWTPEDGEPVIFTVHIKKLSAGAVERLFTESRRDRSVSALMISETVLLGEKADQSFTYEQAYALDRSLATALMDAIDTVNPTSKKKAATAKN